MTLEDKKIVGGEPDVAPSVAVVFSFLPLLKELVWSNKLIFLALLVLLFVYPPAILATLFFILVFSLPKILSKFGVYDRISEIPMGHKVAIFMGSREPGVFYKHFLMGTYYVLIGLFALSVVNPVFYQGLEYAQFKPWVTATTSCINNGSTAQVLLTSSGVAVNCLNTLTAFKPILNNTLGSGKACSSVTPLGVCQG